MSTTAATTEDVDTDLLDAALVAGPKAERTLANLVELVERLKKGTLDADDRFALGQQMMADAAVLTSLAHQVFNGVTA